MLIAGVLLLLIIASIYIFIHLPPFGTAPSGQRLQRIQQSRHYRHGKFQNLSKTPALTEGTNILAVMKEFFFEKKERKLPAEKIPSVKTNLLHLDPNENMLVWFGHSSYFMQLDGLKILVDPVFSGHASPVRFTTKSFPGANIYEVSDLPSIDILFITHDHWDHLDYETVVKLHSKVNMVITSLGVGAHLERWGYEKEKIVELDWYERYTNEQLNVIAMPARHFSGRGFKRNGTLWSSFVCTTATQNIFIGGDSGYDEHFKKIGSDYGPFDLAILEDGQYDKNWKYIHMMPEEAVQAAEDLKAKAMMPVHWGKFSLGNHDWDDPIIRVMKEANKKHMQTVHPMIGEKVLLDSLPGNASYWWKQVGD